MCVFAVLVPQRIDQAAGGHQRETAIINRSTRGFRLFLSSQGLSFSPCDCLSNLRILCFTSTCASLTSCHRPSVQRAAVEGSGAAAEARGRAEGALRRHSCLRVRCAATSIEIDSHDQRCRGSNFDRCLLQLTRTDCSPMKSRKATQRTIPWPPCSSFKFAFLCTATADLHPPYSRMTGS